MKFSSAFLFKQAPDDPRPLLYAVEAFLSTRKYQLVRGRGSLLVYIPAERKTFALDSDEGREWLAAISVYCFDELALPNEISKVINILELPMGARREDG